MADEDEPEQCIDDDSFEDVKSSEHDRSVRESCRTGMVTPLAELLGLISDQSRQRL